MQRAAGESRAALGRLWLATQFAQQSRNATTDVAGHAREVRKWPAYVNNLVRNEKSTGLMTKWGPVNYVPRGFPGPRERAQRDYINKFAPRFGMDGLDDSFFWFRFRELFNETKSKVKVYEWVMYASIPLCIFGTLYAVDHEYAHTWKIAEKLRRQPDPEYPYMTYRTRPGLSWGEQNFWDWAFGLPDWKKTPEQLEEEGKVWPFPLEYEEGAPIDESYVHGLKGEAPKKK
ncbi:unnamed protein product [Pedinophyceae sp. YPF-701]|nr:unnamed protein product [Pedinophyceae sp. YPF-701]